MRGDFELDAKRRARFLSEALRPAPATAEWAPFIETLRREEGSPAPGLSLIEAETIQDEAAAIALILRESLEAPGPDRRSGNAQRKPHRPRPSRARSVGTCRGCLGGCRRPRQPCGSHRILRRERQAR